MLSLGHVPHGPSRPPGLLVFEGGGCWPEFIHTELGVALTGRDGPDRSAHPMSRCPDVPRFACAHSPSLWTTAGCHYIIRRSVSTRALGLAQHSLGETEPSLRLTERARSRSIALGGPGALGE